MAGKDATTAYEDVGHSHDALEIMQGLLVGVMEGYKPEQHEDTSVTSISASDVVIRRHNKSKTVSDHSLRQSHVVEFAALTCIASGLLYAINKTHLLRRLNHLLHQLNIAPNMGEFAQGFLTAGILLGSVSLIGTRYISKFLFPSGSFTSFAPYIQSKTQKAPHVSKGVLDATSYQDFKLRSKTELSDGIYRFVFDLPTKYSILGLPIGQHVAIKAEIDDHTVVRSYTPVSNNRDLGRLELLIRVYEKGLVGNYLKNLPVGHTASIRGPKGAMKYRRGLVKHLGMVAGGTGITPLYQLIRSICEDPNDQTTISLVYGNRNESDIMLREKLEHYAKTVPEKLKIHFVLDNPDANWTAGKGHVNRDVLQERMPAPTDDTKILLCGPPGMVNAVKDGLVGLGFKGPGAVSKMEDQIFCF